ncbi:Heterokaryon incompatibility protein 6, OR allele [Pseudocercospora fuligena]|uniref:Heterokaryon incompatibility protein 6, OR allele n=1 Tax=Pseudocercospora fuligena TaxID=685502 RepID=A0A8H6RVX1_9PEZI|nr:Heterokaryon incompatibility protein 6, OR allele [Pseudocercospora fuligena]
MGKTNRKTRSAKSGNPKRFTPSTVEFRYDHLHFLDIRLMTILPHSTPHDIHCTLNHVWFTKDSEYDISFGAYPYDLHRGEWRKLPYIALSYCWGSHTARRQIFVDGKAFNVTRNLFSALQAIVTSHNISPWYWIDAICINQQNVREKNEQVQKMRDIYASATLVFAWLGTAAQASVFTVASRDPWLNNGSMQEVRDGLDNGWKQDARGQHFSAFDSMRSWKGGQVKWHRGEPRLPLNSEVAQVAIDRLLKNRYFQRTWIIPEFINAPRIAILGGDYACSSEYLHSCCSSQRSMGAGHNNALQLLQMRHGSYDDKGDRADNGKYRTLDNFDRACRILETAFRAKCADRRDGVFAMAGLLEDIVEVNYQLTPTEVLVITLERLDHKLASKFTTARLETVPRMRELFRKILGILARGLLAEDRPIYPDKVEGCFMGEWLRARTNWDCSQLPAGFHLPSGRQITCDGPIWKYLLQTDVYGVQSDQEPSADDTTSFSDPAEQFLQPSPQSNIEKILEQALDDADHRLTAVDQADQQLQYLELDYYDQRKTRAMQSAEQKALEISDSEFEAAYKEMFAKAEDERSAALRAQRAAGQNHWRRKFDRECFPDIIYE